MELLDPQSLSYQYYEQDNCQHISSASGKLMRSSSMRSHRDSSSAHSHGSSNGSASGILVPAPLATNVLSPTSGSTKIWAAAEYVDESDSYAFPQNSPHGASNNFRTPGTMLLKFLLRFKLMLKIHYLSKNIIYLL